MPDLTVTQVINPQGIRSERINFQGRTYYRYPDSPRATHRAYFQRPGSLLHRAVWEAAHGPVPDGHEVHHIDHDTSNNRLDNLSLMGLSEHRRESQAHRRIHAYVCAECGTKFEAYGNARAARRFCNVKCKRTRLNREAWARTKASRTS